MIKTCNFFVSRYLVFIVFCLQALAPSLVQGYSSTELQKFQNRIKDHRSRLNPGFKKIKRQSTRYLIVHTSELGLDATLRVLSRGKAFQSSYKTPGGHAHYVVARNGDTYQILDHKFQADHAGLSMWNSQTDISQVSVGIELVGYHHSPITESQYHSLARLLDFLKKSYSLRDLDVLTHSQVAYGRPNPWFPKNHRGRKRCAMNFDRAKAGLGSGWRYDPDVRAERLMADPLLVTALYAPQKEIRAIADARVYGSNVISKSNSAWSIAGEDYNAGTTLYVFPDGTRLSGDQVEQKIGWNRVPMNTRILLNQEIQTAGVLSPGQIQSPSQSQIPILGLVQSPVKTISETMTAWSHAGPAYREATTIYFLPSGRVGPGSGISDWDDLPARTRLIVGYKGPFSITKAQTAFKIAGHSYKDPDIVYYLPSMELVTGDRMKDFSNLPQGAQVFLPLK